MKTFTKLLNITEKIIKIILFISLAVLCIVAFVEVFRRYLFKKSFMWADELCRDLLIWITFLGATLLFRKRRLVHFDFGHDKLPPRVLATITLVSHIISMIMLAYLSVRAYGFAFSKILIRQISVTTGISMSVIYGVVPISFTLMFLYGFEHLPKLIRDVFQKTDKGTREVWD